MCFYNSPEIVSCTRASNNTYCIQKYRENNKDKGFVKKRAGSLVMSIAAALLRDNAP